MCKFTSSYNTNHQYCLRHTITIQNNDNELKNSFVTGEINHEVISRRTNSFGCCIIISHTLKIYNNVSPINQPLNLKENKVHVIHNKLGEIPLSVSPLD